MREHSNLIKEYADDTSKGVKNGEVKDEWKMRRKGRHSHHDSSTKGWKKKCQLTSLSFPDESLLVIHTSFMQSIHISRRSGYTIPTLETKRKQDHDRKEENQAKNRQRTRGTTAKGTKKTRRQTTERTLTKRTSKKSAKRHYRGHLCREQDRKTSVSQVNSMQ